MTDAAFSPGDRVRRYWADSEGWADEVGEVLAIGGRITREEGLDLHEYSVRWADGH